MTPISTAPAPATRRSATATTTVAVLGLGYVGLPTSLALHANGLAVLGVDIQESRLRDIREQQVDLLAADHDRLRDALGSPRFSLTTDARALQAADVVLVCVPTPVDDQLQPDLRPLKAACATVVEHAREGQTIVLTSTSHVGTTRELVCGPLEQRGFTVGWDVFVCFAPERIDPGNRTHTQEATPRVLGGATPACTNSAAGVLAQACSEVRIVSSLEAAEMTKLLENTFRAVNIAFANEMAAAAQSFGLDPGEVIDAAATKPYGFMPFYPSAGVGGHCIPCDPHYLTKPLRAAGHPAPLTEMAMEMIASRPTLVAERALEILDADNVARQEARVLVVGAAYKPGVADMRESPAVDIIGHLRAAGADVSYHDALIPTLDLADGSLVSISHPVGRDYDLVLLATVHPGTDLAWLDDCPRVLDGTYRHAAGAARYLP